MEIAFAPGECVECGECVEVCSEHAADLQFPGLIRREKCIRCGDCASTCPGKGLTQVGTHYSTEALTELLLRDFRYYRHSGGGVTLSGGECTLFPEYLEILLKRLKERNVSVVLQTCGHFNYHTFVHSLLPYIDMVYFDIKFLGHEAHEKYTGRSNRLILENFVRLVKYAPDRVYPRIPLIPGITATEENLTSIFRFLHDCGVRAAKLLPYNPLGFDKYPSLGRSAPDLPVRLLTVEEEKEAHRLMNEQFAID